MWGCPGSDPSSKIFAVQGTFPWEWVTLQMVREESGDWSLTFRPSICPRAADPLSCSLPTPDPGLQFPRADAFSQLASHQACELVARPVTM